MIGEAKLVLPPLVGVVFVVANLVGDLPEAARLVLDLAALGVLFAGFLVVGKLRAQASAAEGAAKAWRDERDAAVARTERLESDWRDQAAVSKETEDTLRAEIATLHVEVAKLEARPTLETVSSQIDQLRSLMAQTAEAVQEVVQSHHRPLPEGGTP